MTNRNAHLLYWGLQVGAGSALLSTVLGLPARHLLMHNMSSTPGWCLALTWVAVGCLTPAPLLWAFKRRLDGVLGRAGGFLAGRSEDALACRYAAIFSLCAGTAWWFAPALFRLF